MGAGYKVSRPDSNGNSPIRITVPNEEQYQIYWDRVQTLEGMDRGREDLGSDVENSLDFVEGIRSIGYLAPRSKKMA